VPETPTPVHAPATPHAQRNRGELIARLLRGSWREPAPTAALTPAELAEVAPLAAATGIGGLAWRVARGSPAASAPAGLQLGWTLAQQ
jgi:hypothetical protein